ncbi:thioredoxin family protein [Fervidibacillus halotolerans]|uniref:Thioredoxin family protein n=1 Tax=Fervidibacillus halotolerans TaxID=2980027 RepID=A0A9E8M226_9BACI|nr:thioredoxin family protein [Fervidibacillus halotolerans]WAA13834.1 thioredoxin family protein [Fervidibacillus halotolerans]
MINIEKIEEIDSFIDENELAFFYVSQPNCGVCRALLPKVKDLLKDYPKIKSAYVNTDLIPEVAEKFSVFTIPVLLLYVEGKEMLRKARFVSMDELEYEISKLYRLFYS